VQEENENVKDDVTVGPKEYEELLSNFDKIDTLTKRLVLALSSKTPGPGSQNSTVPRIILQSVCKIFLRNTFQPKQVN